MRHNHGSNKLSHFIIGLDGTLTTTKLQGKKMNYLLEHAVRSCFINLTKNNSSLLERRINTELYESLQSNVNINNTNDILFLSQLFQELLDKEQSFKNVTTENIRSWKNYIKKKLSEGSVFSIQSGYINLSDQSTTIMLGYFIKMLSVLMDQEEDFISKLLGETYGNNKNDYDILGRLLWSNDLLFTGRILLVLHDDGLYCYIATQDVFPSKIFKVRIMDINDQHLWGFLNLLTSGTLCEKKTKNAKNKEHSNIIIPLQSIQELELYIHPIKSIIQQSGNKN
ncbi:MAG TPA: hypothetical protein PLW93_01770 [Candidatus Absconditabacterales bacterium]|nr:hypothetical protein [Candidatus Absconditabacterales bacterium]HNG96978.1 hypothetical protein [Candidatus Absconditabacterales bacterium]